MPHLGDRASPPRRVEIEIEIEIETEARAGVDHEKRNREAGLR